MNPLRDRSWSILLQSLAGASRSTLFLATCFLLLASPTAHAIVDTNDNGLSDLWEKQYNDGNLFPNNFDAHADPDADGWSNEQEAAAGTDPFDANPPNGYLQPEIVHTPAVMGENQGFPVIVTPEAVTVTWQTLVGKHYTLLYSPDLQQESWIQVGSAFVGRGSEVTYGFVVSGGDKRFWRVAVTDTDTDGDTLTDAEESAIGSSPYLFDTDGDGTGDGDALSRGIDPSGDGSDSDGDGIPDNEIYSILFESQSEEHQMPSGTGFKAYGSTAGPNLYLTSKATEKYSVSNSARYPNVTDGEHVTTRTYLVDGMIPEDAQAVTFESGTTFSDWKSSNLTDLDSDESLSLESAIITTNGPITTQNQIKTITSESRTWTVKKDGIIVRSGTEVITHTMQSDLSDEVTYPQFWNNHVKLRPWYEDPHLESGPLNNVDELRSYLGDSEAAEFLRDSFVKNDFEFFGGISWPGISHSNLGWNSRLKNLRWRWIKFNPLDPFNYQYSVPPTSARKSFYLFVSQNNYLAPRAYGSDPIVSQDNCKGIVEIECTASEGTNDWQTVPLSKFAPYQIADPTLLADFDFSKVGHSSVWFGSLPMQFISNDQTSVSADDHSVILVFQIANGWTDTQQVSSVEWQIESGSGGTLSEAETELNDGLAAVTLNTSTVKGTKYIVRARVKSIGTDHEDISEASPWIKSTEIEVIAGKPHSFEFATTQSSYHSDGTDTTEVTATIKDQYDNLVEDETPVGWAVAQCPTFPFVSRETSTVAGIAKAVLRAPLIPDDQIVVCSAGDKEDTVTVAVESVTGTISGNVNLDIGSGGQSTITVNTDAADDTPVYWTSSNGEITDESSVSSGVATATLSAAKGRLGTVVVTATIGDRLLYKQGEFSSSSGLAIGAERPVLIAGATADGVRTPSFPHGIARSIPYYASTPVHIKGPANGLAQLTLQASLPLANWDFDQAQGNTTPSRNGNHAMTLTNATIDEDLAVAGAGSLAFQGTGTASVADSSDFHFTDQFNVSVWLRPSLLTAATIAEKVGSWRIVQLSDGRIQAIVTTGTGTHSVTTAEAVAIDQWTQLTVDFRFNRLQIKLGNHTAGSTPTTGTIAVTGSGIQIGAGFQGHLDQFAFRAGDTAGSYINLSGVGAGNTVQLDANGVGTFTVTSTGQGSNDTKIRIFSKVNPEAETEVTLVDPDVWDYTCDTLISFIGGDPATNAGTVSSIAGGFLVVGDIGSCTKNLWRMAGWSDKKPNYVELSLGGLGILTTFAQVTVVGAPADAGVASAKTLAIRFVGNPKAEKFLTVFIDQLKNAAVGKGGFGWPEANFLAKMVTDIPVSDAFKLFMHDDALAKAAVRATEKLGDNAESFYQATRRAVASHGEEAAKKFVQAFEGLGDEAFDALKNAPAGELDEALDGLANITNKGIAPFSLTRVLNNSQLYSNFYQRTNLLKDLDELVHVEGLELAVRALKQGANNPAQAPQALGRRLEIQVAAQLKRDGKNVTGLTERISNRAGNTDIDVLVTELSGPVFYQVKSTTGAFRSLPNAEAWVKKAMTDLDTDDYTKVKYVIPNGVNLPPKIAQWFSARGITVIDNLTIQFP